MRESVFFELRLRRFGAWQAAVRLVAVAAIAAMSAWSTAMWDSPDESARALVLAVAVGLSLAATALDLSLGRVQAGVLTCADGAWTYLADSRVRRSGAPEVAMDRGAFLLLRLFARRRAIGWLPVQRRGLEAQWHGLRCAVYSPPPVAAVAPAAVTLGSE